MPQFLSFLLVLGCAAPVVCAQTLDLTTTSDGELVTEYYRRAARISEEAEKQAFAFQELSVNWALRGHHQRVLDELKAWQFPLVTRFGQISGLAKAISSKLIDVVPSSRDEKSRVHRADLAAVIVPDRLAEGVLQNARFLRERMWPLPKEINDDFKKFLSNSMNVEAAFISIQELAKELFDVSQEFNRRLSEFKN